MGYDMKTDIHRNAKETQQSGIYIYFENKQFKWSITTVLYFIGTLSTYCANFINL